MTAGELIAKYEAGEREFSYADLRYADLHGANLSDADLSDTNLRGAEHSWKVPVIPDIHRAICDAVSKPDSFDMDAWHRCETTHCRAGWAIHLAGEAGYLLESIFGPSVAGALIYQASDPTLERVPDWTASNTDAMADIKRLAGVVDGPPAGEEREG